MGAGIDWRSVKFFIYNRFYQKKSVEHTRGLTQENAHDSENDDGIPKKVEGNFHYLTKN